MIASTTAITGEISSEFPKFKTQYKSASSLMKLINLFMVKSFMSDYTTTIGNTIYLPTTWDSMGQEAQCVILRHERVHMRQAKRLSFPLFALLYLVVFLPIGLAYFRAKFEMEAYAESLAALKDYGMTYNHNLIRERLTAEFTGPGYGWMWPFKTSVEKWYDSTIAKLDA